MVGLGYPEVGFIYPMAEMDFYVNVCKETKEVEFKNETIILIRVQIY
jgi:hypothetical protein